jgi:hypothetical protein
MKGRIPSICREAISNPITQRVNMYLMTSQMVKDFYTDLLLKKCVENAVTVIAGDGPKLSYAQGCCQSCINCHETIAASAESTS